MLCRVWTFLAGFLEPVFKAALKALSGVPGGQRLRILKGESLGAPNLRLIRLHNIILSSPQQMQQGAQGMMPPQQGVVVQQRNGEPVQSGMLVIRPPQPGQAPQLAPNSGPPAVPSDGSPPPVVTQNTMPAPVDGQMSPSAPQGVGTDSKRFASDG